jgi:diguanylate cyclase (GGDEF)-like protein
MVRLGSILRSLTHACLTWARSWVARQRGSRTLVSEILSLQMLLTALAGVLAIAGLFWTSERLLLSNVNRWALQWVDDVQELGAPLYVGDSENALLNVERFVDRYPELTRVAYFDADGVSRKVIHGAERRSDQSVAPFSSDFDSLRMLAGRDDAYVLRDGANAGQFVIRSVIWTESIAGDGLFELDSGQELETKIDIIGFVELDLDFAPYFGQIESGVWVASLVLVALLLSMGIVSRILLKRSLRGLSSLQAPIERIAQGDLNVEFPQTTHREIAAIAETLNTTMESLRQRDSKLMKLANHDALTGLYNRHRFVDELISEIERVARERKQSALLFIDLDQFKYVNDTCGHPAGDKLLICAARQLRQSVRRYDMISRFGGDEFAILVRNVGRREVKAIALEILAQMRDFTHVENDHVFQLQCSIGVTMISSNRWSADEIVAQADVACHEAKRRGRNRMEFYRISAKETEQMSEDVGWTQRIKEGLANDQFVLHYQPIVHIATGETSHHEVLLRLQQPDGRIISPNLFLPAAERFGLMLDVDRWVIDHAIAELGRLQQNDPGLCFTINLSAHAFEDSQLHGRIRDLLDRHSVRPSSLVFEITEQVAIRNLADVERQLAAIKGIGCKVAIDDFGTGYSSFSHLKRFKFDYLKIDGSFVEELARDPVDQTMVRLFADIGKGLGVKTIAEYVTNATSYSLLAKFGIDFAQGYHVGRPTAEPITATVAIPIAIRARRRKGPRRADGNARPGGSRKSSRG